MNVLYHLTILPPKMPACEALSQEINTLRGQFGGDLVYLNPNQGSPIYIPRLLFGFHKLRQLRAKETTVHLHHLYNPDPFPFPILRWLRRPVVYCISSGVGNEQPNIAFFSSLAAVAVYDERSLNRLRKWGLGNCTLVRPGIDTSRFTHTPLSSSSLGSEIKLMVGSAPWTRAQFRTKGIDALLEAARRSPKLRLVFLWRGVLVEEMERRVHRMNLEKQVVILNKQVDVNRVLANVHASVTLASAPGIVKSYPHSLLESLAAGKPVLVSRAIPMADYVEQTGCGKVVDNVTPESILAAIDTLATRYQELQESAQQAGKHNFSLQAMLESFQEMYQHVLDQTS